MTALLVASVPLVDLSAVGATPTVRRMAIQEDGDYPDASSPGSIARVCASSDEELRAHLESRGAPFEPSLVRRHRGERCHIDYEPTLPGFRADPDDRPVRELFINVDSLSFLAMREGVFGDSLDISKALVRRLPERVTVTLGTRWDFSDEGYGPALAFHYGDRAPRIEWRRSRVTSLVNPWTQDYLKSGRVDESPRILVTRRLFEGRREDGEEFRPMLDALTDRRFVRSRLSWEGGDLQLVRHPRDPDLLVLFFGDSAKAYWGGELSQEEYAYVLRRELGADVSIDFSRLEPHVDYFVAFLPADGIALVSQPSSGDGELALAAAVALEERFHGSPPTSVVELREHLEHPDALSRRKGRVRKALAQAKADAEVGWPIREEPGLVARAARYIAGHCPESPSECFEGASVQHLLATEPRLLRDWAQAALQAHTDSLADLRLLSVIESQLPRRIPNQKHIDQKVGELEDLGFQVVRVPRVGGGDLGLQGPWSGLSYVNNLLVDRMLFVPQLGLGRAEQRILDDLDRSLPDEYEVIPVPARHMLLNGGGVHCAVAIVRD